MSIMTLEVPDELAPQEVDGRYVVEYTFHQGRRTAERIRKAAPPAAPEPTKEERLAAFDRWAAAASELQIAESPEQLRESYAEYLARKHLGPA